MDGFYEVDISYENTSFTCWQKVVGGEVVARVDENENEIVLPEVFEENFVSRVFLPTIK